MGNKHRPFYRVVVAKSTAGRDGSFIEQLGVYNPIAQPKVVEIDGDRALHWLRVGAQPTETVAVLLKKQGVLEKFFEERPNAQRDYSFLNKTTSAMSKSTIVDESRAQSPTTEPVAEPAPEAKAEAAPEPVVEASATEETTEAPAEAPAEEVAAQPEETPAPEAQPEETQAAATEEPAPEEAETEDKS